MVAGGGSRTGRCVAVLLRQPELIGQSFAGTLFLATWLFVRFYDAPKLRRTFGEDMTPTAARCPGPIQPPCPPPPNIISHHV